MAVEPINCSDIERVLNELRNYRMTQYTRLLGLLLLRAMVSSVDTMASFIEGCQERTATSTSSPGEQSHTRASCRP